MLRRAAACFILAKAYHLQQLFLVLALKLLICLQFVADGVFYAELNELLTRELAEHGYSGVEVRVTPIRTEIIIRATRTQNVLGKLYIVKWRKFQPAVVAELVCLCFVRLQAPRGAE